MLRQSHFLQIISTFVLIYGVLAPFFEFEFEFPETRKTPRTTVVVLGEPARMMCFSGGSGIMSTGRDFPEDLEFLYSSDIKG